MNNETEKATNLFPPPTPIAPLFSDKISASRLQDLTPDELALARDHAPAIEKAILDARAKGYRYTVLDASLFPDNTTVTQELIAELCGTHDLDVTNAALGDFKVSWAMTDTSKRRRTNMFTRKNYLFAEPSSKRVCEEQCDETMHIIRNSHTPADNAFSRILETPMQYSPKEPFGDRSSTFADKSSGFSFGTNKG